MFKFDVRQFNRFFPFYILLDRHSRIKSFGDSLAKLYQMQPGRFFNDVFSMVRPSPENDEFSFTTVQSQVAIIRYRHEGQLVLRGNFEALECDERDTLFVGSPWFESIEQVIKHRLTIKDFAIHDPMIDMLHILKNQEIATEEVKVLLGRVNEQKEILKRDKVELKHKENMLEAISWATGELLSNPDFFDAVSNCLSVLGHTVGVDKIYFFQNGFSEAGLVMTQRSLWRSRPLEDGQVVDDLTNIPLTVLGSFLEKLQHNEVVRVRMRSLPEGSALRMLGDREEVQCALVLPVFLKKEFWGLIAFTDNRLGRVWQDSEQALLKSFTNSVAHALDRAEASREIYGMALFAFENPDPMIRVGLDGRVLLRNEAARQLEYFVVDGNLLSEKAFFDHLIAFVPAKESAYSIEAIADDKVFHVVARISETGEHINIYARDITDEKRVENQLKDSNERLSTLIVNLQTGVLLEDETRHIVLTNRMFCSMFGIHADPEALKGADCSQASEMSKNLFADPDQFVNDITAIIAGRQPVLGQEIEMADGRIVERDYIPIVVSNIHRGHLWKYKDITAQKNHERTLKKQEEKYRSIIENMNLGLIEVNTNDEIQYANQTMCKFSGYALDELMNQTASSFFTDTENRLIVVSKMELRRKGVSDSYELQARNKRGELRWWLVSGAPNYNDRGELIGSIGIHLDITEQKQWEAELRVAKMRAEESSKAKENFLANMSHEIRTPLNAVIGMMRELGQTDLSSKQSTYLNHAGSASQHLLSIINNILDLSKIEAGELHLEDRTFDLASVCQQAEAIMAPAAKEKLIDLVFNIAPDIAPAFSGDPSRIRQILLNIVSNAVKFTEKGSVTVTCHPAAITSSHQTVLITVSDTGIGMEKTYLENLFKKFSQEDVSTARRYGGTGLGMAITHELVQLMNGKIEVKSEKNIGTQFQITLTLGLGDVRHMQPLSVSSVTQSLAKKKILLVEDNELNRFVAINSLSRYDVEVTEAGDGLEAIAILEKVHFDLILMDLQMPNLGGLDATRRIRRDLKLQTPIIALTANAFKTEIDKCFEAGMNDYVTKPFEETALIQTMQRNLEINGGLPDATPEVASETPQERLYDLSQLYQIGRGSKEFVSKFVGIFCRTASESLVEMQSHLQSGNYAGLQRVAHRVKPSIDNLGIGSLHADIRFLEAIPDQTPSDEIHRLVCKVVQVIGAIIKELEEQPN